MPAQHPQLAHLVRQPGETSRDHLQRLRSFIRGTAHPLPKDDLQHQVLLGGAARIDAELAAAADKAAADMLDLLNRHVQIALANAALDEVLSGSAEPAPEPVQNLGPFQRRPLPRMRPVPPGARRTEDTAIQDR
jgi:hypothetical protein